MCVQIRESTLRRLSKTSATPAYLAFSCHSVLAPEGLGCVLFHSGGVSCVIYWLVGTERQVGALPLVALANHSALTALHTWAAISPDPSLFGGKCELSLVLGRPCSPEPLPHQAQLFPTCSPRPGQPSQAKLSCERLCQGGPPTFRQRQPWSGTPSPLGIPGSRVT